MMEVDMREIGLKLAELEATRRQIEEEDRHVLQELAKRKAARAARREKREKSLDPEQRNAIALEAEELRARRSSSYDNLAGIEKKKKKSSSPAPETPGELENGEKKKKKKSVSVDSLSDLAGDKEKPKKKKSNSSENLLSPTAAETPDDGKKKKKKSIDGLGTPLAHARSADELTSSSSQDLSNSQELKAKAAPPAEEKKEEEKKKGNLLEQLEQQRIARRKERELKEQQEQANGAATPTKPKLMITIEGPSDSMEQQLPTAMLNEEERAIRQRAKSSGANAVLLTKSTSIGHAKDACYQCRKRVYPAERLEVEGKLFHKGNCFQCVKCQATLKPTTGGYGFFQDAFYCLLHHRAVLREQAAAVTNAALPTTTPAAEKPAAAPPPTISVQPVSKETRSAPATATTSGPSLVPGYSTHLGRSNTTAASLLPHLGGINDAANIRSRSLSGSVALTKKPDVLGLPKRSNLGLSTPSSPATPSSGKLSGKQALLEWCKRATQGYPNVDVTNFHTSWRDGLAFCAIIHRYHPEMINFKALDPNNRHENCRIAFAAADKLGITQLLDVEDVANFEKPDEFSVMTYLSENYHHFKSKMMGFGYK